MSSLAILLHDVAEQLKKRFEQAARPTKLTHMQWRVMGALARLGAMSQTALVAELKSSPMTISDLLERLEEKELVTRETDPNDSRAKLVSLTNAGKKLTDKMKIVANEIYAEALQGIPAQDIETMQRALEAMNENLQPKS